MIPTDEIKKKFTEKGVDLNKDIVFTCRSGIQATVAYFAAKEATNTKLSVYDGSWSEYSKKKWVAYMF